MRFLISNKLERLEFKFEKIIGIEKHAGKVRKRSGQKIANFTKYLVVWIKGKYRVNRLIQGGLEFKISLVYIDE